MAHDPNCPFCQKMTDPKGWVEGDIVWRFPHSIAVLGVWQQYSGYCVLVSREHATELSGLGPNRTAFLDEMARLAEAIEACFHPHKLNYELLGNQVPHLHWHIFPRYATDPDLLRPVWFALAEADADTGEKRRLELGTVTRPEAVARLREWLAAHNAPRVEGA